MKKFLDILLIVLITMFIFNLFSDKPEDKLNNTLDLWFVESSYTIPASVWVYVKNSTSSWITLNTCTDLNILSSWEKINFSENFCKDITIESWSEENISFSDEYSKFDNIGKFILNAKIWDREYIDQFELENKGSIKKIFVSVFYAPLYNLVIGLIDFFKWSFWFAIIWVTIIIRIVLLWPQHKMMVSQRKLQAIQPKIKKIQEEFKWNQQMLWMKMMELYKKEKVNPVWSCGFLLIQMPILLVIYNIVLWIQDPVHLYYLYDFLTHFSLSDINYSFYWLELLESGWVQWAILAISVATIQFIQVKLSLASKDKDAKGDKVVLEKKADNKYSQIMPDPEMMNKFMLYWMPSMVAVFTFTLSAWVWIYWGISTLFMLFQQLIVNKIIKK